MEEFERDPQLKQIPEEDLKRVEENFKTCLEKMKAVKSGLEKIDFKKGLNSVTANNIQGKVDGLIDRMNHTMNRTTGSKNKIDAEVVLRAALKITAANSSYDLNGDGQVTLEDAQQALK